MAGLSHKSAPLIVREALARIGAGRVLEALKDSGTGQGVVLSTCNRFEVYTVRGPDGAGAPPRVLLEDLSGLGLKPHLYVRAGAEAVRHLFEVASGLDSLVVGETEILGQVREAYETAQARGMTGKATNVLFQRALYVGKIVRAETSIAEGQTSAAAVAVQMAQRVFGELRERAVLILGAGDVAESLVRHLKSLKVDSIRVCNRTLGRARELCGRHGLPEPLAWEQFPSSLDAVDILIASTGSPAPVVTREAVAAGLGRRRGRSLFVIDLAVPRDVEEGVHGLENVYVYRLEDLEAIVNETLQARAAEFGRARSLVGERAREFWAWAESVAEGREISLRHSRSPRDEAVRGPS